MVGDDNGEWSAPLDDGTSGEGMSVDGSGAEPPSSAGEASVKSNSPLSESSSAI